MEPATCERILGQLAAVLASNINIGDFDIISCSGDVNVTPVLLVEGNLALASWCVKHVYTYAYHRVMQHKHKIWRYDECESISKWTQFCLLVCPEVSTFWNLRRKLLKKGLVTGACEMQLTKLILSRKPKCMEAFYQRQWVYLKVLSLTGPDYRAHIEAERFVCLWAAGRHQNNYHAWNHRLWMLRVIVRQEGCLALLTEEFERVKEWVQVHVSEHSGLHYINKLVEFIVCCSQEGKFELKEVPPFVQTSKEVYEEMLKWNKSLISHYPGHEALFCARRTLLLKWRECCRPPSEVLPPLDGISPVVQSMSGSSSPSNSSPTHDNTCSSDSRLPFHNAKFTNTNVTTSIGSTTVTNVSLTTNSGSSSSNKSKVVRSDNEPPSPHSTKECVGSQPDPASPPALKRSCVENLASEWALLALDEQRFAEECTEVAESEYCGALGRQYGGWVARMGL